MLKKVLVGLGVLIVVILVAGLLQPDNFRIERSTAIEAPAAIVFSQINNFKNWQAWSPWAKKDPQAQNSYSGPETGEGAAFSWKGNREVGEGKMTIVQSKPNTLIAIQLDFLAPFKATNTAEYTLEPQGSRTKLTWAMFGKKNYVSKLICLFMNMDKMVGGDFEKGLASIKEISEAAAKTATQGLRIRLR